MTETFTERWAVEPRNDLIAIGAYLAEFDPNAATRIAHRLIDAADSLTLFPRRGRLARSGTRELPSVPPYVLRYRIDNDIVTILHVRHGRRRSI